MSTKASDQISKHIASLGDWRGALLARLRTVINNADARLTEDWKWETPVWAHNGNVLAVGAFKDSIKVNFFKGASLPDPKHLFNGGLDAKASRSIDLHQGDRIDESALRDLIRAAVAQNTGKRG